MKDIASKEMIDKFVKDIESANTSLTIVGGEAACFVYNHPKVRESLIKRAQKRDLEIKLMFSPIICIDEDEPFKNGIFNIFDKPNVKVYRRKGRALIHYRVMDHKRVYVEEPHKAMSTASSRSAIGITKDDESFWAERLEDEFVYLIEKEVAEKVKKEDDFIQKTEDEINDLMAKAERKGKSFNYLTKEDFYSLVRT